MHNRTVFISTETKLNFILFVTEEITCLFFLFQASTTTGAGNGDQGEILKLQRTIKVNFSLFYIYIFLY